MNRSIEFKIKLPTIQLDDWAPQLRNALVIPFERDGITGKVHLYFDEESIEWYVYGGGTDSETGLIEEHNAPEACNKIVVLVNGTYPNDKRDEDFLTVSHKVTIECLKQFVAFLKYDLGQYWIDLGRIPEWGMWYFLQQCDAHWQESNKKQVVIKEIDDYFSALDGKPDEYPVFGAPLQSLNKNHWEILQNNLGKLVNRDLVQTLVAESKQQFAIGNYRLATVEIITALEIKLEKFVGRRIIQAGVAKNVLEDSVHKLFLGDHLKLLLPLVLREDELDSWLIQHPSPAYFLAGNKMPDGKALVAMCISMNQMRNKVVHEGQEVDPKSVKQGIIAVELLITLISEDS